MTWRTWGKWRSDTPEREKSTQFGLKSLRLARPLEPGFVVTIEPGIYFIPQLIDLWRSKGRLAEFIDFDELDKWRDFGGVQKRGGLPHHRRWRSEAGPPQASDRG